MRYSKKKRGVSGCATMCVRKKKGVERGGKRKKKDQKKTLKRLKEMGEGNHFFLGGDQPSLKRKVSKCFHRSGKKRMSDREEKRGKRRKTTKKSLRSMVVSKIVSGKEGLRI